MTHEQKVKMARRMRSRKEILIGTPIFQSRQWMDRKQKRREKELSKINDR